MYSPPGRGEYTQFPTIVYRDNKYRKDFIYEIFCEPLQFLQRH